MTYRQLVRDVQDGRPPDLATIRAVLTGASKSDADLVGDAFRDPPVRPGQPCAVCGAGRLRVTNTRRHGASVIRYLACSRCGARPAKNKIVAMVPTN